jgi:hypothetical protein
MPEGDGPVGINGDNLLFDHCITVEAYERWERLLRAGLLPHVRRYRWDAEQLLMIEIK